MKKVIMVCDCCNKQVGTAMPFKHDNVRVEEDFCNECRLAFITMMADLKELKRCKIS
jgi:hypothetical protein